MIQENASRPEQVPCMLEEIGQVLLAHMLDATDCRELVVFWRPHLPEIAHHDPAALAHPRLIDPLVRQLCLLGRKGYAIHLHTEVLCGVDGKAAPAAAYVQQTLSRLQSQFPANVIKLVFLR